MSTEGVPVGGRAKGIHHQILRSQVLEWMREVLVSGELAPGQRVNEVHLANQLGVSRGTLREALRNLEQEGLLVSVPHRGTYVRKLTPKQVRDVYEVLAMVEARAASRASARMTDADVKQLEGLLDTFEAMHGDPSRSLRQRQDADLAFHERVCELADNEALLTSWRGLRGLVMAVVFNVGEEVVHPLQDPDSHRRLLQILVDGSSIDAIEEAYRVHLTRAADALVGALEDH
jgi:DNA-binding GntR family transcriptional regulator